MFFLEPSFLKLVVVIVGIGAAVYGLSFLAIRHRADVLESYFTPEADVEMEEDFFRRRALRQNPSAAASKQNDDPNHEAETTNTDDEWGTIPEEFKSS